MWSGSPLVTLWQKRPDFSGVVLCVNILSWNMILVFSWTMARNYAMISKPTSMFVPPWIMKIFWNDGFIVQELIWQSSGDAQFTCTSRKQQRQSSPQTCIVEDKVCTGTECEEIKPSTSNKEGDQVDKKILYQVLHQVLTKYSIKYITGRTVLRKQVLGAT